MGAAERANHVTDQGTGRSPGHNSGHQANPAQDPSRADWPRHQSREIPKPETIKPDTIKPDTIKPESLRGEQARMWSALLDFSRRVGRLDGMDPVLDEIIATATELTCSRRISLMLPDDDRRSLRIARAEGIDPEIQRCVRVQIGSAIAGKAFESGVRVLGLDPGNRGGHAPDQIEADDQRYKGRAYVSLPILTTSMLHGPQCVGVLNVTNRVLESAFEDWELEFLDLFSRMAGSAIDDLRWREARETMIKVERELTLAREIQTAALPASLPALDGFDIAAWTSPAQHAGGDVYDVIGLPLTPAGSGRRVKPDRAVLLLADVAGHGVGPALAASQTRAMVRTAVRSGHDIAEIMRVMDEQLIEDLPGGRFVCTWLGEIETETRSLRWVSAGIGDAFILHAGGQSSERLPASSPPLGLGAAGDTETAETLELEPGDLIAVVSDGITEALSTAGRQFGIRGVQSILTKHRDRPADQIIAELRTALDKHTEQGPRSDDQTALVIRVTE